MAAHRLGRFVFAVTVALFSATSSYASLIPNGVYGDEQASVAYSAVTGELAIDAPASKNFTSINFDSVSAVFTESPALNLGGSFDNHSPGNIFKATFGKSFKSLNFGKVAATGLEEAFLLNDLTVVGSFNDGSEFTPVDLIYVTDAGILITTGNTFNGSFSVDSDMNRLQLDFGEIPMADLSGELPIRLVNLGVAANNDSSSMDLVSIDRTGDFERFNSNLGVFANLTPGEAREFSVTFDTLQKGRFRSNLGLRFESSLNPSQSEVLQLEMKGRVVDPPIGKLLPEGAGDGTIPSISYDPETGELFLSSDIDLTSIDITSASGIFIGPTPVDLLNGDFDNHDTHNVFKATFGDSFGSISFGQVVQTGLTTEFLMNDLTIRGSRAGGGGLNNVVFAGIRALPEPGVIGLVLTGLVSLLAFRLDPFKGNVAKTVLGALYFASLGLRWIDFRTCEVFAQHYRGEQFF